MKSLREVRFHGAAEPDAPFRITTSPRTRLAADETSSAWSRTPSRPALFAIQQEMGLPIRVETRTGDTPSSERARFNREPADILITTPESLYLMLTSNARETLRGVHTVIVDEVHALVPNKRGAHLAISLERLHRLADAPPQRIGLSATQRPLEEVARFLVGFDRTTSEARPCQIVDCGLVRAKSEALSMEPVLMTTLIQML